ncbi:hypothetical protein CPB86DRAFT_796241 [Serendipita vermifera]|nr:hypothetical protein CPB86DRAFT_796241 [Serendipita vermifera]
MERYLGVPPANAEKDRKFVRARDVANRIDLDLDTFSIGESDRLQRVFFEVVPEEIVPPLTQHLDLAHAEAEEAKKSFAEERAAAKAKSVMVVPVSTTDENGNVLKSATKYKWFYPARAGRSPYTFVDVGDRYLRSGHYTRKAKKSQDLKEKDQRAHDKQLDLARKANVIRRSLLVKEREELSKHQRLQLKRQKEAEQAWAEARSKLGDIEIKL